MSDIATALVTNTCGELSCDECNAQRAAASARIRELESQLASARASAAMVFWNHEATRCRVSMGDAKTIYGAILGAPK